MVFLQHALVEDRVTTGLADHEIGPLHDDDGREESGVTGELQHLALGVSLFVAEKYNKKSINRLGRNKILCI